MPEKTKVLLSPVTHPGLPGTGVITASCGHECWIGEAMMKGVLGGSLGEVETVCLPCSGLTAESLAKLGEEGALREVPGVREEVASLFGEKLTDEMFKHFGVKGLTE